MWALTRQLGKEGWGPGLEFTDILGNRGWGQGERRLGCTDSCRVSAPSGRTAWGPRRLILAERKWVRRLSQGPPTGSVSDLGFPDDYTETSLSAASDHFSSTGTKLPENKLI